MSLRYAGLKRQPEDILFPLTLSSGVIEQPDMIAVCGSLQGNGGATGLRLLAPITADSQGSTADGRWTTDDEGIRTNAARRADSGGESFPSSEFTVITSSLSLNALSLFRRVGKS